MTEATTTLKFCSVIYVGGQSFLCVETYDSIIERLRDVGVKFEGGEEAFEGMQWMQPIELTARGPGNRPLRMAIPPQSIAAIVDVPVDEREDVNG